MAGRSVVGEKVAGPRHLKKWWFSLPHWERELRILLVYPPPWDWPAHLPSEVLNAAMAQGQDEERDSLVHRLNPHVYRKFVEPHVPAGDWTKPGSAICVRGFLWLMRSRRGEPLLWSRTGEDSIPSIREVIDRIAAKTAHALIRLRQNAQAEDGRPGVIQRLENSPQDGWWAYPYTIPLHRRGFPVEELKWSQHLPHQLDFRRLKSVPLPTRELIPLARQNVSVARLYATMFYIGGGLLMDLETVEEYQQDQRAWQTAITKEKRSLRSTFGRFSRYYHSKEYPPEPLQALKAETNWRLASLDRISYPSAEILQKQRKRLRIHRSRPGTQAFWTDLIVWAVHEIRREADARFWAVEADTRSGIRDQVFDAVRLVLNSAFSRLHRWTLNAVKKRYYHREYPSIPMDAYRRTLHRPTGP